MEGRVIDKQRSSDSERLDKKYVKIKYKIKVECIVREKASKFNIVKEIYRQIERYT